MYFDYENSLFERVSTFLFSYMQSFSSIEFQTQTSLIYVLCYDTCTTNAIYQNPACKFRSVRTNFDCTMCRNLACWRLLVSGDDPKKRAGGERDQWMSGIGALIRWAVKQAGSSKKE